MFSSVKKQLVLLSPHAFEDVRQNQHHRDLIPEANSLDHNFNPINSIVMASNLIEDKLKKHSPVSLR